MGEYVDWIKKDIWSKQFQLVILQNPVQIYGTTYGKCLWYQHAWQCMAQLLILLFCSIFKSNPKSSPVSCAPPPQPQFMLHQTRHPAL